MQTVDRAQRPNYWLSTLLLDENSSVKPLDIIVALEENNIESRPIWKPMHMQPVFADTVLVKANDDMPAVSEDIFARGVCLPSDTKMTKEEQQVVIDIIKKLWNK